MVAPQVVLRRFTMHHVDPVDKILVSTEATRGGRVQLLCHAITASKDFVLRAEYENRWRDYQ